MTQATDRRPPWPYPRWLAHRGAGKQAPENTLAAFRLGASKGWRGFECDVKLSSDGVPFLLHDATLERTTDGTGIAGEKTWTALSQLDAGGWHSPQYAGEPMATLAGLARYLQRNGLWVNLEIKPTPGTEARTGRRVAAHAERLWAGQALPPLLSSFEIDALKGAREAAPSLPLALLVDEPWDGWLAAAQALSCVAVVTNYRMMDAACIGQLRAAGLRALTYTVNTQDDADRLLALGIDGIITDKVDEFAALSAHS